MSTQESVQRLIHAAHAIIESTVVRFGGLGTRQLNWKPTVSTWSVGQCFDHLVTANTAYFPTFQTILRGEKVSTFWERLPWYPSLWGKVLLKAFDPESPRRLKAPKVFRPSAGNIDAAVIDRFVEQQHQFARYMDAMKDMDLERVIISSPVTSLVTYSLLDTYRMLIMHERRHIRQATKVLETEGFPI